VTIDIGTAIVSYIEPHAGQAVAFNRWYERDHFPATVKAGPGVFSAARFVATRDCKALRRGRLFGDPARGSYLAVAWVLPGKLAEWDEWVGREMETIAAQGRLFAGRDHIHTAVYRCVSHSGPVDATVALDCGLPGAIVVAGEASPPRLDLPDSGIATEIRLRLDRTIISEVDPPSHELVIGLCAGDPLTTFVNHPARFDSRGAGFASPFLATIPGTDTYADEIGPIA
jgi:hypothetical protein